MSKYSFGKFEVIFLKDHFEIGMYTQGSDGWKLIERLSIEEAEKLCSFIKEGYNVIQLPNKGNNEA